MIEVQEGTVRGGHSRNLKSEDLLTEKTVLGDHASQAAMLESR